MRDHLNPPPVDWTQWEYHWQVSPKEAVLKGQLPSWVGSLGSVQRTEMLRMACDPGQMQMGLARIPVWHPEELIPIQSAITYSLRTQFQSNPRLSFSYCLPYLCTNYLWPQDIQRPDTSCYPQQTLISRNHNPSSVLLMLHPSWSACRHYCQSSSVFVPSPSPRAVHIMYLQFKKISQSFKSYLQ